MLEPASTTFLTIVALVGSQLWLRFLSIDNPRTLNYSLPTIANTGGVHTLEQDEVVTVRFPIGCVTLQNTDSADGIFGIHFLFYALDKATAKTHKEVFGTLDKDFFEMIGRKYEGNQTITLQPGEIGTAKYEVRDISMNEDEWLWEFEITPGTKTILK